MKAIQENENNTMLTVCEKLKDTKVGHTKYRRSKTGACQLLIEPFNVSFSIRATFCDIIHLHALLAKVYISTHTWAAVSYSPQRQDPQTSRRELQIS